ncbi:DNA polymerase III subunit delta [Devosia sp.]|uniref:DNA polymerase III subunit delta n=1 Tax=Devosia sp. TaxID=1871048 RepID=UPI002F0715E1
MTALKAHEVERFVAHPDVSDGVFLVYGPDAGLVREIGLRLTGRFGGDDAGGMNLVTLDGGELEAEPSRLLLEARTTSLFGEKRVVRVRGPGKALAAPLAELLAAPQGAAVILEAGNLTPRDPLRTLVEGAAAGRALPCYPDNEATLLRLIGDTLAKAGIRAAPDVAATLRDTLGNDREITRRELEKLVLFAADSKQLTRDDVLALCADNAALVLDEIADAVGTGHAARLDAALARALAASVNPQQLLAGVQQHFAALRRWRAEVDAGRSVREVLDRARPKPHFSRRGALEQQLRLWPDTALAAASERLHGATADARKRHDMQATIAKRALLAVCTMAAER